MKVRHNFMAKLPDQPYKLARAMIESKAKDGIPDARRFIKRTIEYPSQFYVPTGLGEIVIDTFSRMCHDSPQPVMLLTSANRTGKDLLMANIIRQLGCKTNNGWFDYPVFVSKFPFEKKVLYASEADIIKKEIVPNLEKVCSDLVEGKDYIKEKEGKQFYSKWVFHHTGLTLIIKSYDEDPKSFEGLTLGLIILSEPPRRDIWERLTGRTVLGCASILAMTPMEIEPFIIDEIGKYCLQICVNPLGAISKTKQVIQAEERPRIGYYWIKGSIYSACENRGIRGYIPADKVDNWVSKLSDTDKMARAYGEPTHFSQTIFPNLSREKHYVDPEKFPLKNNYIYLHSTDPHDGRPNFDAYCALTPEGRYIFFYELPIDKEHNFWDMEGGMPVDDHIFLHYHTITRLQERYGITEPFLNIMDRHYGTQSQGARKITLQEEYGDKEERKMGTIDYELSYSSPTEESELAYGHKRIQMLLSEVLSDGYPRLIFYNNGDCHHIWNALTHYVRRMLKGSDRQYKAEASGKPIPKYKDGVDAVRYAVCHPIYDVNSESKDTYINVVKNVTGDPLTALLG